MGNNSKSRTTGWQVAESRIINPTKVNQFFELKHHTLPKGLHHEKIIVYSNFYCYFAKRIFLRFDSITKMLLQTLAKRFQLGGHRSLSVGL